MYQSDALQERDGTILSPSVVDAKASFGGCGIINAFPKKTKQRVGFSPVFSFALAVVVVVVVAIFVAVTSDRQIFTHVLLSWLRDSRKNSRT